jgi:hypothetical protein
VNGPAHPAPIETRLTSRWRDVMRAMQAGVPLPQVPASDFGLNRRAIDSTPFPPH